MAWLTYVSSNVSCPSYGTISFVITLIRYFTPVAFLNLGPFSFCQRLLMEITAPMDISAMKLTASTFPALSSKFNWTPFVFFAELLIPPPSYRHEAREGK